MGVSVRIVHWKFLNMLKTSHRTKRTSLDLAGQGADSPDKKKNKETQTDTMTFYPLLICRLNVTKPLRLIKSGLYTKTH